MGGINANDGIVHVHGNIQDIFSEEFAAQAQAQLGEAMKLLSKEDPQLWQQLQGFASSAAAAPDSSQPGPEGERKEEGGEGGSVEATLQETLRRLRESTEQIEVSPLYVV